jgi:hypothetical protein
MIDELGDLLLLHDIECAFGNRESERFVETLSDTGHLHVLRGAPPAFDREDGPVLIPGCDREASVGKPCESANLRCEIL